MARDSIREAVGVFFDADKLREAAEALLAAGFTREDLGLLAAESSILEHLGDVYTRAGPSDGDGDGGPRTAFVRKRSVGDALHAWLGSLFFAGATTAAGAAVVSTTVFGGALLTAATGAAAIGAVGAALALIIHESDADYLEQQLDEGHLLLFVRTRNPEQEDKAVRTLSEHAGFDARIHEVRG
jgi:hypothetical protein